MQIHADPIRLVFVCVRAQLVAIVDPPRSGLHKRVIQALLKCAALKRIVYISCKPASMTDNLKTLCTPPDGKARPRSQPSGQGAGVRGCVLCVALHSATQRRTQRPVAVLRCVR